MIHNPNISLAFIFESTYTEQYPFGMFLENHLKSDYKILRHFTTEFLEIPLNLLNENMVEFSIRKWIKELPEFDILILEETQELIGRPFTQEFLGEILFELINTGKKVIITSAKNSDDLSSLKGYLYFNLPKELIFEGDFQNDLF
jgi:hypothetical protein